MRISFACASEFNEDSASILQPFLPDFLIAFERGHGKNPVCFAVGTHAAMPNLSLEVADFASASWTAKKEAGDIFSRFIEREIEKGAATQQEGRQNDPQQDVHGFHVAWQTNILRVDKQELECR
jgi:hypothetical protein